MSGTAGSRPPARQGGALGLRLETSFRKAPSGPRMLQGGEAGPLGREALGRDGRLRVPACGLPLLSSLPREGREQPRGSSGGCEGAGARPGVHRGRQSAATSPSPATATGGSRNSFHLAEQTWSSDALSISAPAHGHHRLTVFMLVASWPEVAATARGITPLHCRLKQKEVGGAEGDVSQKLPGRFLLKRRCAGPDHVPPWHRGLGKQTCGSDDQHGHRPLRRGQVRWPQTKSGFT